MPSFPVQSPQKPTFLSGVVGFVRGIWATFAGKIVLVGAGIVVLGGGGLGVYTSLTKPQPSAQKDTSTTAGSTSSPNASTGTQPADGSTAPQTEQKQSPTQPGTPTAQQPAANTNAKPASGSSATGGSTNNGGATGGGNTGGSSEPEAFKANCIQVPSSCGYPDATSTGVPAGVTLTNSGSFTVTQDGTVVDAKNVTGQIVVRANNVTIRNTRITSAEYYPIDYDGGFTGLLVEDTEIAGLSTTVTAGISFRDYTARRVYIHGTADGLKADANVLIEDSFITSLRYDAINDSHNDGLQTTGGSNVTVRHNTFKLSNTPDLSAIIQIGTEWGSNSDWLVTDNLFDGGGYVINSGPSNVSMKFTNNRFTRAYGYGTGHTDGMTWTGNYYDDNGAIVP